ncbi:hypothetical protein ABZS95_42835 [Streptomyces sp. NPDC005479]|uniref:hypothetical protein n=1 Tax=unclassified Streptomyces TaxID=2593676 RepID=UPI0033A5D7F0
MTADYVTLADDPDLAHLIDLIDMLREPGVAPFWDQGGDYSIGKKSRGQGEDEGERVASALVPAGIGVPTALGWALIRRCPR